ncbi:hypothetical protein QZH41_002671 [Actinostola sp. cb2023]|nr:hypothetical protein QZH41_002671 [Actinostola sp. cb2023]
MGLVVESDHKKLLPPPSNTARILKTKAVDVIESWYQKYGSHYKKLDLGYHYLKRIKHVEFDALRNRSLVERRHAEDREQRKQRLLQKKVDKVEGEIADQIGHMELCITEMNNCLKLLLPHPDNYEVHGVELSDAMDSRIESRAQETKRKDGNKQKTNDNASFISNKSGGISDEGQGNPDADIVTDKSADICNNDADVNDADNENNIVDDDDTNSDVLKDHGLGSRTYEISIKVNDMQPSVDETEDNAIVLETAREMNKEIIHQYIPMVNKWLQIFSKAGYNQQRIQSVIDLKGQLRSAKDKFSELNILPLKDLSNNVDDADDGNSDDDDDDDEFVDVPEKEGIEYIPPEKRAEYGLEPLQEKSNQKDTSLTNDECTAESSQIDDEGFLKKYGFTLKDAEDPTSHARALLEARKKYGDVEVAAQTTQSSTSAPDVSTSTSQDDDRRRKLLDKAPVISFDMDLYHWEDPNYDPPKIIRSHNYNNHWASKDAETEQVFEKAKGSMLQRKISFGGKFEPVKWSCRAPLPSGKLCPRKDRHKCPFHGIIMARDDTGKPVSENSSSVSTASTPSASVTNQNSESWKDIQHEIEAATAEQNYDYYDYYYYRKTHFITGLPSEEPE